MNYTRTHTGLVRTRAGVVIGGGYEPPEHTTEPAVFVPQQQRNADRPVVVAGAIALIALAAMGLGGWL
jgi:hypothetical protein